MDLQSRKISFVQEVLALKSEEIIDKLEELLKRELFQENALSAHDLLGTFSDEEAEQMKKVIEEVCEQINEDDWK